ACLSCFISSLRILMSSCRSVPYSALPANHRESQVRLIPTRSPIGLTSCPTDSSSGFRPRLDLTHDDRQVRKRLENASDTAAAARGESLDHKCLADMRLGDDEIVDVEIVIVLGVSDRRFQALAHVLGDTLARKLKVSERARNLLAADQLRDKVELLRRDPQHLAHSLGLVFVEVPFALALPHDVTLYPLACRRSGRCCRWRRSTRCRRRARGSCISVRFKDIAHAESRVLCSV